MPDFSVVICAYTEARWGELVDAVCAVQAQSLPAREVIVVIDHNHALWQRASHKLTGARVLENTEARGLSGARNTGIRAARGEVIAFMDEDAVPARDWLRCLRDGYTDANVLGVGGAIAPMWEAGRPRWFPDEVDWVVGCTYRGMPERPSTVRNLIGCNMSFRRELFFGLGGFRDGIGRIGSHPVGCEETELCIRAGRLWPQGVFVYQPEARVFHRVPAQRATWQYFRSRCFYEGRSKALVTQLEGQRAGLSSERTYTLRTLPRGVVRGLGAALAEDEWAGAARAVAITAGLLITLAGYATGAASVWLQRTTPPTPVPMMNREMSPRVTVDVRRR